MRTQTPGDERFALHRALASAYLFGFMMACFLFTCLRYYEGWDTDGTWVPWYVAVPASFGLFAVAYLLRNREYTKMIKVLENRKTSDTEHAQWLKELGDRLQTGERKDEALIPDDEDSATVSVVKGYKS